MRSYIADSGFQIGREREIGSTSLNSARTATASHAAAGDGEEAERQERDAPGQTQLLAEVPGLRLLVASVRCGSASGFVATRVLAPERQEVVAEGIVHVGRPPGGPRWRRASGRSTGATSADEGGRRHRAGRAGEATSRAGGRARRWPGRRTAGTGTRCRVPTAAFRPSSRPACCVSELLNHRPATMRPRQSEALRPPGARGHRSAPRRAARGRARARGGARPRLSAKQDLPEHARRRQRDAEEHPAFARARPARSRSPTVKGPPKTHVWYAGEGEQRDQRRPIAIHTMPAAWAAPSPARRAPITAAARAAGYSVAIA